MSKKNTVYEDKAEKEAKRRLKEEEYRKQHLVQCPHCGSDMLDHMKKCPCCGKEVKPSVYQPMDEKKIKKIRWIAFGVLMVVAVVVLWLVLYR